MSKIGILGDLHIRKTPPQNRIDDFETTLSNKFSEMMNAFVNEGVELILQPGDMFDSSRVPYSTLSYYLEKINDYGIKWAVVYGQHDQRFHSSDIKNTPLNILTNTPNVVRLKRNRPLHFDNCSIWGRSWNEKFPNPKNLNKDRHNILVAHAMVIGKDKLWSGQTDFMYADTLMKEYPFDIFVLGDNHTPFYREYKTSAAVNCGSLTRQSIDQDHNPQFYVLDDVDGILTRYYLDVSPIEEVFNVEKAEKRKKQNEELDSFVEQLNNVYGGNLNFRENLTTAMNENKIDKGVRKIIEEALP